MSEWKEVTLKDITQLVIDYRGKTPLKLGGEWSDSGYRALSAKNVKTGIIVAEESIRYVDEDLYRKWMKDEVQRGDILITSEAPFGEVYFWNSDEKIVLSQRLFDVRIKNDVCAQYVYYYMTSYPFQAELKSRASGTTVLGLKQPELLKTRVLLPDYDTQKKIAVQLSEIDDKIAVNKKICENLEAQAQALFKHWFVDFAPFKDGNFCANREQNETCFNSAEVQPKITGKACKFVESELGLIPEGWRVCSLGEICKCELGGTPSRANKSYWGGNIAWINSGEVNKFRICEASEFITEEGLNHSATKLLPAKTTVLAITGATLGQVSLLEIDSCANQSVVGVKENKTIPYTFIYPAIKCNINKLVNMQTGGAQQHINKDNIQSLQIIEAPKNIMEEYKLLTLPLYEEIGNLCFETIRLATLRDALLPKLMSGQIKL